MNTSDRLSAWLVTGPVGRFVAFVCDLAVAVGRGVLARVATKLGRR